MQDPPLEENRPGVSWVRVDYGDQDNLAKALKGTETVLSFVQGLHDPERKSEKNLIDACIKAGVKRFAPSEFGRHVYRSLTAYEYSL